MTKNDKLINFGFNSLNVKYVGSCTSMITETSTIPASYEEVLYDVFLDKANKVYVTVNNKVKQKDKIKIFKINNCYNFKNARTYEMCLHTTISWVLKSGLNKYYQNNSLAPNIGKKSNLTNNKITYICNYESFDDLGLGSHVDNIITDAALDKCSKFVGRMNNPFSKLTVEFNYSLLRKLIECKKIEELCNTINSDIFELIYNNVYESKPAIFKQLGLKLDYTRTEHIIKKEKNGIPSFRDTLYTKLDAMYRNFYIV